LSLIQDAYGRGCQEQQSDPMETIAGPAQTASWYCKAGENYNRQKDALINTLSELIESLKSSLNFHDLQIVEMLFYYSLSNKDIAKILRIKDSNIALIKHRL
jgi:DNA-directed RNA polymerase specialized sigma subunit